MYYTTIVTRQDPQWNADAATIIEDEYSFTAEEQETTVTYDVLQDKTLIHSTRATDIRKLTDKKNFHVTRIQRQKSGWITNVVGTMDGNKLSIRS